MKISFRMASDNLSQKVAVSKKQSFKGLSSVKFGPVGNNIYNKEQRNSIYVVHYFYPFSDDKPDAFEKFSKDVSSKLSVDYVRKSLKKPMAMIAGERFVQKETLPFTKAQWETFSKNSSELSEDVCKLIEKSVKKWKL